MPNLKHIFSKISLRTKLIFMLITVLIFLFLISLFSVYSIRNNNKNLDNIENKTLKDAYLFFNLTEELYSLIIKNHALIEIEVSSPNKNRSIVQIQRNHSSFSKFSNIKLAEYKELLKSRQELELVDMLENELINYQSINKEINRLLINRLDNSALEVLSNKEFASFLKIKEIILSIYNIKKDLLKNEFSTAYSATKRHVFHQLILSFILFLIILVLSVLFLKRFRYRIDKLKNNLFVLKEGQLPENKLTESDDEIGILAAYSNTLSVNIQHLSSFVNDIIKQNYDIAIDSSVKNNILGSSLLKLRDSLQEAQQEESKRKVDDDRRNWTTQGLAKFGDLLRQSSGNLQVLGDEIIKNLVYYLKANQGGLFIYNDADKDDIHLHLLSAFAYDRKKFISKKVALGDGLVGMCALEKSTMYLTEIPEDYIEIESGLGEAKPTSLLIVPLKTETEILGILEIASFNTFAKYEIEFVERLGASIASTLATVRINTRTAELLQESQIKSEELAKQEKELRRTMSEMKITQENSLRREAEMSSILSAIDETLLKTEINTEGIITSANQKFLSALGYRKNELIGLSIKSFVDDNSFENFDKTWESIIEGNSYRTTILQKNKKGEDVWLLSQYTPVFDAHNKVIRVLYLANDISEQKSIEERNKKLLQESMEKAEVLMATQEKMAKNEIEMSSILTAIDQTLMKAEYSVEGELLSANPRHITTMGYDFEKTKGKNILTFIPDEEIIEFKKLWQSVCEGNLHQITVKRKSKQTDDDIWLLNQYTPVKDSKGQVLKILYMAIDITKQKNIEEQAKKQADALAQQEEAMRQNMEELFEDQQKLEKKFKNYIEQEIKKSEDFDTNVDKKYNEWLKNI